MNPSYASLADEQLVALLSTEEDRLPRDAVDEILRRGPRLIGPLAGLVDRDALWDDHGPAGWAPVHAVYLLAALRAPEALDPVLRGLARADDAEEMLLVDASDSMLAAFGPAALPDLRAAAREAVRPAAVRVWINDAIARIALDHDELRPAAREHLREAALRNDDEEVCAFAAENFLEFAQPGDRDALDLLVDRALISREMAAEALEGRFPALFDDALDWLGFYDPAAIAARQETSDEPADDLPLDPDEVVPADPALRTLARLDEPAPSGPILNASPKVGRNDPCPCGSGRKFKKCCGQA